MLIGGIQTLTLLDFPGKVGCIVFTAGCNFRCGFCHNPQFVDPEQVRKLSKNLIPESKFFSFLKSRRNFLDGVVVSGGEPTIQADLVDFLRKIREFDFLIKLDTNGTNPDVLERVFSEKLVDFVAMDIKNSPKKYSEICGVGVDFSSIERSKNLILNSKIDHEFRTTVLREFHDSEAIFEIAEFVRGTRKFTIQNFRSEKVLNPKFEKFRGFSEEELDGFREVAKGVLGEGVVF